MEVRGEVRGVTVYDDFAHHPTAIATTVAGLRRKVGKARILAVLEPRSNTMKLGTMKSQLPDSLREVDAAFCYAPNLGWDAREALAPMGEKRAVVEDDLDRLVDQIVIAAAAGRPHPGHEQRRFRRHPRQAAGGARRVSRCPNATVGPKKAKNEKGAAGFPPAPFYRTQRSIDSTTASAVMLTRRRTVAVEVRTCTGRPRRAGWGRW
jgi:hypothetical protein